MAVFLQTNEVGFKRTTVKTDIPNNDVARLMYYLNCVCTTIDCKDDADIQRLISYQDWHRLSNGEQKTLVDLCRTISPGVLHNKVFFQYDALCVNFINEFYEISKVQNQILAAESIFIAGRTRQVNTIMVYKQEWMQKYYIGPMQRLVSRLNNSTSSTITHTRSTASTRPAMITQPVTVKSSSSKKSICICCCLSIVIFIIVPIIIGIIIAAVNSKK